MTRMSNARALAVAAALCGTAGLTVAEATAAPAGATTTTAAGAAVAPGAVRAGEPTVPGKLLLMLDASGSMNDKDPSGLTKIAAAKKSLVSTVDALPADAQVGLRVYGATQPGGKPTKAACTDTQLVHPITTLDKTGLTAAITSFQAKGETPIAYSLRKALGDLGATGKRNIVLVSDGQESCVPDPCPVIRKLVGAGVNLQIDTVGFGVDAQARKQLQCIADAGRGSYYDAKDADQLDASLAKLSQRALRPFTVSGTPVVATADPGTAPRLVPGQYTDRFTVGKAARYYRIDRAPGATVRFSLVARPPVVGDIFAADSWVVELSTESGRQCARDYSAGVEFFRAGESVAVSTTVSGVPDSAYDKNPCLTGPLVARVEHGKGSATAQDVELVYLAEPRVTATEGLPSITEAQLSVDPAPVTEAVTRVVGGGSFSNSLLLGTGTYRETLLSGEETFYRVRLDWGQSAAFTVDVPEPGGSLGYGTFDSTLFQLRAYNPARDDLSDNVTPQRDRTVLTHNQQSATLGQGVAPVMYRNREPSSVVGTNLSVHRSDIAGYYYFSLTRGPGTAGKPTSEPITARIRVAVRGTKQGAPPYAAMGAIPTSTPSDRDSVTPSPTGSSSAAASAERASGQGSSMRPLVLGLGGLVVLVGAGATYLLRRRAASSTG